MFYCTNFGQEIHRFSKAVNEMSDNKGVSIYLIIILNAYEHYNASYSIMLEQVIIKDKIVLFSLNHSQFI